MGRRGGQGEEVSETRRREGEKWEKEGEGRWQEKKEGGGEEGRICILKKRVKEGEQREKREKKIYIGRKETKTEERGGARGVGDRGREEGGWGRWGHAADQTAT